MPTTFILTKEQQRLLGPRVGVMVEEIANSLHERETNEGSGGRGAARRSDIGMCFSESLQADVQQETINQSPSAHLQHSGQLGGDAMTVEERRDQERRFAKAVISPVSGSAGGKGAGRVHT